MKEKRLKDEGQLVKEELTKTGRVGWRVYQFYAKSVGHISLLLPLLFFFVGQVGVSLTLLHHGSDKLIFLMYWYSKDLIIVYSSLKKLLDLKVSLKVIE